MYLVSLIEKIDSKYGAWIFYAALILFLISASWFWPSNIPDSVRFATKRLMFLAQVLCCFRISLLSWKYPKYVLICAVLIVLFYVSAHLSHQKLLLRTVLFVAASRDSDIKVILRIYLVVFLVILFVAPITWMMGWTGDIVKHKFDVVGHSWGFSNPNRFAFFMQMLMLLAILLLKIRRTLYVAIISWAAAAVIGWMTLSMTSVVVLLLFPVFYYCFKHHSLSPKVLVAIPVVLTILSIGLSIYYGPSTGDTTFESRFSIPHLIVEGQGISWLGQDYGSVSWYEAIKKGIEPLYMNNLYLNLIVSDGVIIALITLALYGYYLYRMGRLNNPQILSMAICLAIAGLMQLHPMNMMYDFLLLYFFQEPFVRKKTVEIETE